MFTLKLPIQRGYTSSKDVFGYIHVCTFVVQNSAAKLVNIKLPCSVEDKLYLLVLCWDCKTMTFWMLEELHNAGTILSLHLYNVILSWESMLTIASELKDSSECVIHLQTDWHQKGVETQSSKEYYCRLPVDVESYIVFLKGIINICKHRSWTHKFRRIVLLLALTKLSKEQILLASRHPVSCIWVHLQFVHVNYMILNCLAIEKLQWTVFSPWCQNQPRLAIKSWKELAAV